MANIKNIIKQPLITEKATALNEKGNFYVFAVDINANRIEIKRAVEQKYSVGVTSVNTVTVHGQRRKAIGRQVSRRRKPDWKKAIIKLKEGDKIEVFEGV